MQNASRFAAVVSRFPCHLSFFTRQFPIEYSRLRKIFHPCAPQFSQTRTETFPTKFLPTALFSARVFSPINHIIISAATCSIIYVSSVEVSPTPCGSSAESRCSFVAALQRAVDGDTLVLQSGNYSTSNHDFGSKSIRVEAEDHAGAIFQPIRNVDPQKKPDYDYVFRFDGSSTTVRGVRFLGSVMTAIRVLGMEKSSVRFEDCEFMTVPSRRRTIFRPLTLPFDRRMLSSLFKTIARLLQDLLSLWEAQFSRRGESPF